MTQEKSKPTPEERAKSISAKWQLTDYEILPGEKYVIGRHRVMFGYRLRVHPLYHPFNDDSPVVDWCIAANPNGEVVYRRFIQTLVDAAGDEVIPELPFTSNTRPVYNDPEFHVIINAIAEQHGGIPISEELRKVVQDLQIKVNPFGN